MSEDPRIARTRRRVLEAAYVLLTEVGFDGVTIDLISERSGTARSTLYRHWETREEILRDAFTHSASAPGGVFEGSGPARTAEGLLIAYAGTFAHGLSRLWGRAAVSLSLSALDDEADRAVQATFVDGSRRDLAVVVEVAAAAGELPGDVEVNAVAERLMDLVIAPMFYRYQFVGRAADAEDATAIARASWAQVLREFNP